jgi:hypothetical protein
MRLNIYLALFAIIAQQATAQYTFTYWANKHCGGGRLLCSNIPAFRCCEAPPSPRSFQAVKVTSSGAPGVVIFTYVTAGGGCGNCQFTSSLNHCHVNMSPFNTGYVVNPNSVCSRSHRDELTNLTTSGKQPVSNDARSSLLSECTNTYQPDTTIVGRQAYDIMGPERETIIDDISDLSTEEFAIKWSSVHKGPASN